MAAMTYLSLVNSMILKCGISGGPLASLVNQRGESSRVIAWVNEAYRNIQELRQDWLWMEADVSFPTVNFQGAYTPAQAGIADFADWQMDSFRSYTTAVGTPSELFMGSMDYERFRNFYLFGTIRTSYSRPMVVSVAPDKSLLLGMAPDAQGYTVTGKYFRTPVDLVADTDLPLMPARFHMLIVYEAMKSYALYEAASEVMAEAERQYGRMLLRLTTDQSPEISLPGALA